ncbi:MAG: hypothetical protein SR1Q5_08415 [Quinella sp. 1Q5]|nr:hypothetical protein [Quinella sp. 1Q5]
MANDTIKHFIFVRFFSFHDAKYPHDIFDVDFLLKQLPLARNVLNSLENQTNKNFELIFVLHPRFFDDLEYSFIFSTLEEYTTLPIKFMRNDGGSYLFSPNSNPEVAKFLEDATKNYDYVITTRIDYDDFIYKDAVADTQSKIKECDSVLGYGYCLGYEYSLGDLYYRQSLWVGNGHLGIAQSLILKSSFAKQNPVFRLSVENFDHHILKTELKRFLEHNGVEFSENMFQQNTTTLAYIYFRHENAHAIRTNNRDITQMYQDRKKLTVKDITKKQLAEEFGFHLPLKSIKDKEFVFDYDFTSIQAEEFGSRQDLTAIKWVE